MANVWSKIRVFGVNKVYGGLKTRTPLNPVRRKWISERDKRFQYHIDNILTRKEWHDFLHGDRTTAISILRSKSEIKHIPSESYANRRIKFNRTKWQYFKKWTVCKACKVSPVENIHHIILLKNGGSNHYRNLTGLCSECHSLVHDWMPKSKNIISEIRLAKTIKGML